MAWIFARIERVLSTGANASFVALQQFQPVVLQTSLVAQETWYDPDYDEILYVGEVCPKDRL